MAKRQNESGGNPQPARVRYFELEGSDETIQKALATFERMRNPAISPSLSTKRLVSSDKTSPEPTLFEDNDTVADAEVMAGSDEGQDDDATNQRRKRGDGPSVDRNSGITAAGDLDFYPQGEPSLKDFFAEKAPKSDVERCLVFCYYLQETLATSPFGIRHVMAGFRDMRERIPADLRGTLRNMREGKKGSKGWLSIKDLDNIRVTTGGLNLVLHEMGKKSAPKDDGAK